ncbi:MAG: polysaccharide lyase family 1 protein, partial [Bacteroidales bacterium]|nr:polysaccharide lyase family 1 protein [Bacteroidales bacterium]
SVIQLLVADGSTGGKLANKAISSVKLTSSAAFLSGRLRVDITTGEIDQWDSSAKYNYVAANYGGNDWTAGSDVGGMVLTAPATLPSGSILSLQITTTDDEVYIREVELSNDVALEAGKVYTFRFTFTDSDLAKEVESLKPVTEITSWSSTFTKCIDKYGAGKEVTTDFILDNLGFVAGGSKFKFANDAVGDRVQFGGTGAAGTKACIQFMAAGNGKLTVIARSSGEDARPLAVAVGASEAGRKDAPDKASNAASLEFDVTASNGDLINIFSANSALNIYEIKWVPEGCDENPGGNDDPVNPLPGDECSWDFSESAWQTSFASYGAAASTDPLSNYDNTIAGLSVKAEAFKYSSNYFQMAKAGSNQANYFKFTVAEAGVVSVVASHTGTTLPKSDRYCTVYNNSTATNEVASVSSKSPKTCNFNVSAGDVYVYTTSENVSDGVGMRFYKIYFTAGASVDPENPVLPDEAQGELEIPADQKPTEGTVELDKLYGYAEGVTGGDNATPANVLHFDSGKALQTWLLARTKSEKKGDHSPVIIWLSGTFGPDDGRDFSEAHPWFDVKDVSNLSFYGTDGFVMDRIGIFCVRASNIIIRNINFQQPKANNGADAVSMQECDGVWVDHCTFTSLNQTKDYEDGSTDVTHGSKNVTVSWCRYIKTQKSCLVGHSNSQSSDVSITATFHHNWFDGSSSRHPRVRFGRAHVYNNLYDGCTTYGAGSAYGAKVLVEYNYFDSVQLPTDICTFPAKESNESNLQGSVAGYLFAGGDILVNRPGKAKDPYPLTNLKYKSYNGETLSTPLTYADFKPGYNYVVTPAENVPEVVKAGAGYGKLGWANAPVAVNNGNVNPADYNGEEEDPVDPDPGSGEEPGDNPGGQQEEGTHVHVFYYNTSNAAVNLTDGAPGNYFTASAKTDLSSDYSQNFNPWTIGNYSSSKGVKLNSTGAVTFTTSATLISSVRFYFIRRKS